MLTLVWKKMLGLDRGPRTKVPALPAKLPVTAEIEAARSAAASAEDDLARLQAKLQAVALRMQQLDRDREQYDGALTRVRRDRETIMRRYAAGEIDGDELDRALAEFDRITRRAQSIGDLAAAKDRVAREIHEEILGASNRASGTRAQYWAAVSEALAAGFREKGDLQLLRLAYAARAGRAGFPMGWEQFLAWAVRPVVPPPLWDDHHELLAELDRLYAIAPADSRSESTDATAPDDAVQTSAQALPEPLSGTDTLPPGLGLVDRSDRQDARP